MHADLYACPVGGPWQPQMLYPVAPLIHKTWGVRKVQRGLGGREVYVYPQEAMGREGSQQTLQEPFNEDWVCCKG